MAKSQNPLEAMMRGSLAKQPSTTSPVVVAATAKVTENSRDIERVSLYVPRQAYKYIKQIALDLDCKPHDLIMQGIELLLKQHGKSFNDFKA